MTSPALGLLRAGSGFQIHADRVFSAEPLPPLTTPSSSRDPNAGDVAILAGSIPTACAPN